MKDLKPKYAKNYKTQQNVPKFLHGKKDLRKYIIKENMENKHVEKYQHHIIKNLQIKTRYHYIPIRMAKIKN